MLLPSRHLNCPIVAARGPWGQHCEGSEAAGALDSSTLSWAPEALTKSSEGFVIFRDLRNVVV